MTAKIKINDLPKNVEITKAELESIRGGIGTWPTPEVIDESPPTIILLAKKNGRATVRPYDL